ncbi:GLUG motif-containing protein [Acinetobacter sp.]|nr:GLUG motif-containing protein [Acinetobacter sp.]MDI1225447.1 GLUG motif-containing protein [Acinetobacter sp.]
MNKIYKVIWNSQLKCWQAVSELAKNHNTSHSTVADKNTLTGSVKNLSAMALMRWTLWGLALLPLSIYAAISNTELPTGANITKGSANIAQNGNTLNIHQNSQRLSTNWDTFNIGKDATVNFNQQNQSSIAINRVLDSNASQIMGRLNANGQVFLLNPNGVIFSKTAQVNVGGLVATTLSLNDSDIQNGKFTLTGNPNSTARVENHGSIQTLSGGTVALIAPNVKNTGRISSPNGANHLTAASQVTLALQDGSLTQYQVDQGVFQGLVDNGGAIIADNGAVYLTAKAKDRLSKAVVNHSGIIEANRLSQNAKGEIILLGDMQNGETNVSGVLKAEGRNGQDGGFIETSAAKIRIDNSTVVSTRSAGGKTGNWLIDPIDFNINAGNAPQNSSGMGATTLANNLANNNVTVQSSTGGSQKGDINVNAEVKWDSANSLTLNAHNDININANITATHNRGKLNLIYGQDTANSNANYKLNKGAKINLRAGDNFSTKKGTDATVEYKVITALGAQGSTTGTDLQGINGNLNGNYVLGADIDATETQDWNDGQGFNPIGDGNNPFKGKLDGLGHTVSRLYINRPTQSIIGLIGYAQQVQIRNIGLLEVNIRGKDIVGGLVGYSNGNSSINNAYATGSVSGNNSVGGLVGFNNGSINNAYSTVSVSGNNTVGGLVGLNSGSIHKAYATGAVSGKINVGGLVGWNSHSIQNAYSTGSVLGEDRVGGLVGTNQGDLRQVYATGQITGTTLTGGLIGFHSRGTVENAYWNTETTGQNSSWNGGNGVNCNTNNYCGLTTAEMFQKNNMKGFDFNTVWGNANDQTTPYLLGLNNNQVFNKNDLPVGAITASNRPALYTAIQNIQQLQNMQRNLAGNYAVVNNIDAIESKDWNAGQGFNPIGDGNNPFKGKLDGLGHTVSRLYINRPEWNNIGLIGFAEQAKIRNIVLWEANIRGNNYVGGLVGYSNGNSSINNAYATGSVSGNNSVGGLAGYNNDSKINNAYSTASVSGQNYVGGLVGYNNRGTINNTYTTGSVSGDLYVGGLVGYSNSNSSINNAYATSFVSGQDFVGGLVGWNDGNINDAYTTGNISGNINVGGLVGVNGASGSINNAYTTGSVVGKDIVGGLVGRNFGSIKNAYATASVSGQNAVGGLVGYNNDGSINNVYATGSASGDNRVGGLVGLNGGSITNAYTTGSVSGKNNVGGLVGFHSHGTVENAYWNRETTGQNSSAGGGKGLTTAEMFQKNNMKGFDFKGVWGNANDQTTPYLLGLNNNQVFNKNDLPVGAITASNRPALYTAIQNIQQLQNMQRNLAGNYAVVNNIDATESKDWNAGQGFNPIGDANNSFKGKLDGLGYTVSKLYINRPTQDYIGLIGSTDQAQIANLGLLEVDITGSNIVGGLVGWNGGHINNAYATGNILGKARVGGLVGDNFGGSVNNAYWDIETTGQNDSAGGKGLTSTQMKDGRNFAFIDADSYLGGKDTIWRIYQGDTAPLLRSFLTQLDLNTQDATTTYNGKNQSLADVTGLDPNKIFGGKSGGYRNAGSHQDRYYSHQQGYDLIGAKNTASDAVLTINKATLNLNAVTDTRSYDGTNQSTGMVDIDGVQTGDRVTAKQVFDSQNAGERTLNIADVIINDGNNGGNYNIVTNTAKGQINKAKATVTANSLNTVYNGKDQTVSGFTASGLVNGETESVLTDVSAKATGKDAGQYTNKAKGTDKNYELTFVDGSLDIAKAKATVTANSLNTVYNGKEQSVSGFTASGLVNGETESVLTDVSAKATGKDAGQYANKAKGKDKNYELTFIDGLLDIAKAKATITANSLNTVYNGKEQTVSGFTASGLVNGETESVLTDVSAKATGKDAGNYANKAKGTDKNYELIFVDGALDIAKAKATVTANSLNTVYNGKDQTVSGFTASGLVNGETESVLSDVKATVSAKDAGKYVNKAKGTDKNYDLIFVDGALDIAKAKINQVKGITANNRGYDGTTNASLNTDLAQFEGLITGDELAVASATGKFNDKNVGVGKPVSIQDIRLTGADARNYQLVDNTAMTTADIYALTPLAYLQAKQFKPPRYLPETHNGFNTVDLEVQQGGVNIAGIRTLAGEH